MSANGRRKQVTIRKREAVPAKPRAIRWVPGRVVAFRLRAGKFAVLQMLPSPSAAIMGTLVKRPDSTEAIAEAMAGPVYAVLSVHRSLLAACDPTGARLPPVASRPSYFSRDPNNVYLLWGPDGWAREARVEECRGLEVMAVWDEWNLRDRLVRHFLKGGYQPELG